MRLFPVLTFFLSLAIFSFSAQAPGAKKPISFDELKSHFPDPDMLYAPSIFWFWDRPLDDPGVQKQIRQMAQQMVEQRYNPGYVHARFNMVGEADLPFEQWLSDHWFNAIASALDYVERHNAYIGYVDEYWWPSGQAAGRVLEMDSTLKATSLEWTRQEIQGPANIKFEPSKFTVAGRLSDQNRILASTLKVIGQGSAFDWLHRIEEVAVG